MLKLIEALKIFLKYGNLEYPTACEHDTLYVNVSPGEVDAEDIAELEKLGFFADSDNDNFYSFKYGSC